MVLMPRIGWSPSGTSTSCAPKWRARRRFSSGVQRTSIGRMIAPSHAMREQRDDMVGVVAERDADDVAGPHADVREMAGGLQDQPGELRVADGAVAIDDGRMRGRRRALWKIASATLSQPCGSGTAMSW